MILKELPPRLRTEISLEINGGIMEKVPFFKDTNPGFITALVGKYFFIISGINKL